MTAHPGNWRDVSIAKAILFGFKRMAGLQEDLDAAQFQSLRRFSLGSSPSTIASNSPSTTVSIAKAILFGFKLAPGVYKESIRLFQSLRRFSLGSSTFWRAAPSPTVSVSIAKAILFGFKHGKAHLSGHGYRLFQSLRRFSLGSSGERGLARR